MMMIFYIEKETATVFTLRDGRLFSAPQSTDGSWSEDELAECYETDSFPQAELNRVINIIRLREAGCYCETPLFGFHSGAIRCRLCCVETQTPYISRPHLWRP